MDALTATLKEIANRLEQVPGIKSAHYPAINSIQDKQLPAAIVYSGSPNAESLIERNTGGIQLWTPAVMVQLLGKRVGNTPQEFAAIDALIVPVVDAFHSGFTVDVDGRPQHIDRVLVNSYRASMQVEYAGHVHYAAEFYLSIKFRRSGEG
jgi:hypothetical protein